MLAVSLSPPPILIPIKLYIIGKNLDPLIVLFLSPHSVVFSLEVLFLLNFLVQPLLHHIFISLTSIMFLNCYSTILEGFKEIINFNNGYNTIWIIYLAKYAVFVVLFSILQ